MPPYVIEDGPPHPSASTHLWTPVDGPSPPVLNDPQTFPVTLPFGHVVNVVGWDVSSDIEDDRDPRTAGPYEIPYPPTILGKTLVYEVVARGDTEQEIRHFISQCRWGFTTDRRNEGLMVVTPYVGIGGPVWTFNARCLELVPDKEMSYVRNRPGGKYRRGFTISFRMSDPRFYTDGEGYG